MAIQEQRSVCFYQAGGLITCEQYNAANTQGEISKVHDEVDWNRNAFELKLREHTIYASSKPLVVVRSR